MERPNTSAAHSKRTAVVALVVLVLFLLMISPLSGTSGACVLSIVSVRHWIWSISGEYLLPNSIINAIYLEGGWGPAGEGSSDL